MENDIIALWQNPNLDIKIKATYYKWRPSIRYDRIQNLDTKIKATYYIWRPSIREFEFSIILKNEFIELWLWDFNLNSNGPSHCNVDNAKLFLCRKDYLSIYSSHFNSELWQNLKFRDKKKYKSAITSNKYHIDKKHKSGWQI